MNTYINKGDWIVKNSSEVYDNAWITVRHSDVITPGGTNGIYGEVNFKNLAIGIIPISIKYIQLGNSRGWWPVRYRSFRKCETRVTRGGRICS